MVNLGTAIEMFRINWSNLPPDPDGMSLADIKKAYKQLYSQLEEAKRQKRAIASVSKANRKDLLASRSEAKAAKGPACNTKQKAKGQRRRLTRPGIGRAQRL